MESGCKMKYLFMEIYLKKNLMKLELHSNL